MKSLLSLVCLVFGVNSVFAAAGPSISGGGGGVNSNFVYNMIINYSGGATGGITAAQGTNISAYQSKISTNAGNIAFKDAVNLFINNNEFVSGVQFDGAINVNGQASLSNKVVIGASSSVSPTNQLEVMALGGMINVGTNGILYGNGSGLTGIAGGGAGTFNAAQFNTTGGNTNIASGALLTNIVHRGPFTNNIATGFFEAVIAGTNDNGGQAIISRAFNWSTNNGGAFGVGGYQQNWMIWAINRDGGGNVIDTNRAAMSLHCEMQWYQADQLGNPQVEFYYVYTPPSNGIVVRFDGAVLRSTAITRHFDASAVEFRPVSLDEPSVLITSTTNALGATGSLGVKGDIYFGALAGGASARAGSLYGYSGASLGAPGVNLQADNGVAKYLSLYGGMLGFGVSDTAWIYTGQNYMRIQPQVHAELTTNLFVWGDVRVRGQITTTNGVAGIGITNSPAGWSVQSGRATNSGLSVLGADSTALVTVGASAFTTHGRLKLGSGSGSGAGYVAWHKEDDTRLGYMGFSATDINLNLENSAKFRVVNGNSEFLGSASVATTLTATNGFSSRSNLFILMPTNAPTDGYVLTAAGTGGFTKWAAGGSGSGIPLLDGIGTNTAFYSGNVKSADMETWQLFNSSGVETVDFSQMILGNAGVDSVDWGLQNLNSSLGTILHWEDAGVTINGDLTVNGAFLADSFAADTAYITNLFVGTLAATNWFATNAYVGTLWATNAYILTNSAPVQPLTNVFVLGTRYTNANQRAFVSQSFGLVAAAAGTAAVTLSVEQGNGITNTAVISVGPLASLVATNQLSMIVSPNARYTFIDSTSGSGASAVVSTNTATWIGL